MPKVEIGKIDPQGRVILPPKWRKEVLKGKKEVCISLPDRVEIIPPDSDLELFLDSAEVEIAEGKFLNYHELRHELRKHAK